MVGEDIDARSAELAPSQQGFLKLSDEVPFAGEQDRQPKFIKLEDVDRLYPMDGYMLYGHGTGRAGNDHETIEKIFEEGLRGYQSLDNMITVNETRSVVGSTDLTDTAVGLWGSSGGTPYDATELKDSLDHWKHLKSENIILMRLPEKYYHAQTSSHLERFKPYFTVAPDSTGQKRQYLDRRFILGNYNTQTGLIELNEHFEPEVTGDFKAEMDARLASTKSETVARQARLEQSAMPGIEQPSDAMPSESAYNLGDFDFDDWGDYPEEDWS